MSGPKVVLLRLPLDAPQIARHPGFWLQQHRLPARRRRRWICYDATPSSKVGQRYYANEIRPMEGVVPKELLNVVVDEKGRVERSPYEQCVGR